MTVYNVKTELIVERSGRGREKEKGVRGCLREKEENNKRKGSPALSWHLTKNWLVKVLPSGYCGEGGIRLSITCTESEQQSERRREREGDWCKVNNPIYKNTCKF